MILVLIVLLLFLTTAVLFGFFSDRTKRTEVTGLATSICFSVGIFLLVVVILFNTDAFYSSVKNQESIVQSHGVEEIYRQRSRDLVPQFKSLLAEEYPAYEGKIFSEIKNTTAALYFLGRYPEIKASETIMKLVDEIRGIRDAIYAQGVLREGLEQKIRSRRRDPWLINSIMP